MARYFFNLHSKTGLLADPDGRELADSLKIAPLALAEARCLMSHDTLNGFIDLDQCVEVLNERGETVHHLRFADAIAVLSDEGGA